MSDINDILQVQNLEKYLEKKIPKLMNLDLEITKTKQKLAALEQEKDTVLKQELDELKRSTGIEHLLDKTRALSKLANGTLQEGVANGQES